MKKLEKLKGDASFRKFYRKRNKKSSSIIVYSKKERIKNLLIYDTINKILIKNKILAPKLLNENYKKNFLEVEDFGNDTIYKIMTKKKSNKLLYFKKIIKVLNQIQVIHDKRIQNFKDKIYIIPKYDKKILIRETNLFCNWYIKEKLSRRQGQKFIRKFKKIITKLTHSLKLKNDTFVHRDFHVSNLMLVKNKIAVIDSQDALIGNKAYDLASLIDDVRLKNTNLLKDKIYKFYMSKQKKINKYKFRNDFEILSILRNLKIIGIFTRLATRDNKKAYLKLIPYAWRLISMRINGNKIFIDLKNLLNQNFKEKLNEN